MTAAVAGLLHGLILVALAAGIGGLLLDLAILPKGLPELAGARTRLRHVVSTSFGVMAAATIAQLVVRTQAMSRAPLGAAVANLPEVVAGTHLGVILAARVGALVLAGLLSLVAATTLRICCLLIAFAVALTLSLTGHAATWGDVTWSVAVDWTHAVAASAWIGGLFGLALAVLPGRAVLSSSNLGVVARRFSRLAGLCLLAVILSGLYNAWSELAGISRLWTTAYGRVLLIKLALVVMLVWLGAMNRYAIIPRRADRGRRDFGTRLFRVARLVVRRPWGAARVAWPDRLATCVTREALLAVAVFACTATLGEVTPGRHSAFERKPASHVTNITPSRSAGAGSVSGTVTPPPGNVSRGRAVFVKLRCFACHPVRGEQFPAPSRPGPDLGGIGREHPGYLVESIMNPNGRIVDGPGYTDDRGLSTMPDYREKITVGELIDLVAYLKSLDAGPARP